HGGRQAGAKRGGGCEACCRLGRRDCSALSTRSRARVPETRGAAPGRVRRRGRAAGLRGAAGLGPGPRSAAAGAATKIAGQ
ncbi:unnamed protein product, partial [Effrenium voratum]